MKYEILFIYGILILLATLSIVQAESIGTFKQNECLQLIQTCGDCTWVNISSVINPNSIKVLGEKTMTKTGTFYNYSFCNTSVLGTYNVNGHGDENSVDTVFAYDFEITPSGSKKIGSGEGLGVIGILFLIIVVGITFFIIGFKVENVVVKIGAICFSIIVFIIAILYIVIFAQQNLYGFEGLVSGVENFWFVMKILLTIGILVLFIIVALILIKAWKIKRGYIDVR